jgi:hypothetical protein
MADTVATMMESLRSSSALVAREAHLLDVLVDRGVLLDIGVARGHVGFGW